MKGKMKNHILIATICFFLLLPWMFGQTHASTDNPSDQLQQLAAQLQKSPDDQALREKIIALALTLNPKPTTPDAATMAEGGAEYAFKDAKTTSDYSAAAKQYEKALLLAPWLADDYFNCGVAHEKAGENKDAIRNFKLYLLAAPNADNVQTIKKRIGGLQYAAQKGEEEANSPEAKLAKFLKTLDGGVWRMTHDSGVNWNGSTWVDSAEVPRTYIAITGQMASYSNYIINFRERGEILTVVHVDYDPNRPPTWTTTVAGHKFSQPQTNTIQSYAPGSHDNFTISDDGSITEDMVLIFGLKRRTMTATFERFK
jgi:tetratricopeptide (TPR) repeat protein